VAYFDVYAAFLHNLHTLEIQLVFCIEIILLVFAATKEVQVFSEK